MYPWHRTPTRLSLDGIGQILVGNLSHCLSNSSLESTGAFSVASLNGWLLAVIRCRGTINPDTLVYVALASVMYQCNHIEARTTAMPCSSGKYGCTEATCTNVSRPSCPLQNHHRTVDPWRSHHGDPAQRRPISDRSCSSICRPIGPHIFCLISHQEMRQRESEHEHLTGVCTKRRIWLR